jgi:hypothetical protein
MHQTFVNADVETLSDNLLIHNRYLPKDDESIVETSLYFVTNTRIYFSFKEQKK